MGEIGLGVHVGIVADDRDLEHGRGVGRDERTETAIAGGLGDQAEGRGPEQDRVPAAIVGICRDDDRARRIVRRVEQRPDHLDRHQGLVAERDENRCRTLADRLEPDPNGAREPALRVRIDHAALRAPGDRVLDGRRVVAEDHDDLPDPGRGKGVEDVLEDRPAGERRDELAATEPRPGASCEHDSHRPIGHTAIFPPVPGRGRVRARARATEHPAAATMRVERETRR